MSLNTTYRDYEESQDGGLLVSLSTCEALLCVRRFCNTYSAEGRSATVTCARAAESKKRLPVQAQSVAVQGTSTYSQCPRHFCTSHSAELRAGNIPAFC